MAPRGRRYRLLGGFPLCNKILVAVDFDHTLIDTNSDTHIAKLAPGGKFPEEMTERYSPGSWTLFMRAVFRYLYRCGVRPEQLLACIREVPLVDGMREWLQALNSWGIFEVVIISDANTVFIEHMLFTQGVRHLVHEVFSNFAQFDGNGRLNIHEYHRNDWCKLCPANLCKGKVISDYIDRRRKQGVNLQRVVYIGDGKNDYCPAVKCKRTDLVFVRRDFELDRKLSERTLTAKVIRWNDGHDILEGLSQLFPQPLDGGLSGASLGD